MGYTFKLLQFKTGLQHLLTYTFIISIGLSPYVLFLQSIESGVKSKHNLSDTQYVAAGVIESLTLSVRARMQIIPCLIRMGRSSSRRSFLLKCIFQNLYDRMRESPSPNEGNFIPFIGFGDQRRLKDVGAWK